MPKVFIKVKQVLLPPGYKPSRPVHSLTAELNSFGEREKMECEEDENVLKTHKIFALMVRECKKSFISINLIETGALRIDRVIGQTKIMLCWFARDAVITDWFPMQTQVTDQAIMIQLKVHLASNMSQKPFSAFPADLPIRPPGWEEPFLVLQPTEEIDYCMEHRNEEEESESWEGNVQLIHGSDDSSDSTNNNDSVPTAFWTEMPLASIKNSKARVIDLC